MACVERMAGFDTLNKLISRGPERGKRRDGKEESEATDPPISWVVSPNRCGSTTLSAMFQGLRGLCWRSRDGGADGDLMLVC